MIVVFVVDTSPSMGEPLNPNKTVATTSCSQSNPNMTTSGMSKLDIAKMTVESISKMMQKRIHEHNNKVQEHQSHSLLFGNHNGYSIPDQFLLLSTGRQVSKSTSAVCGAGGRLLVGFGEYSETNQHHHHHHHQQHQSSIHHLHLQHHNQKHEAFEKELKLLKAFPWNNNNSTEKESSGASESNNNYDFPEDGGGSKGLNIALSTGLQLLSRYRLHNHTTENFGMGRLPSNQNLIPNNIRGSDNFSSNNSLGTRGRASGSSNNNGKLPPGTMVQAGYALQPACLILLTDGECLKRPRNEGGGSLELQFNLPLREFYREPFRWDQRTFCLGIGEHGDSLHPSLRALCDVTGGFHTAIKNVSYISKVSEQLLQLIAPPIPNEWPLPNPLYLPFSPQHTSDNNMNDIGRDEGGVFVNGGPICCFQQLEPTLNGTTSPIHRAMLLYAPNVNKIDDSTSSTVTKLAPSPIWCIPESYFPSKKLDSLPSRSAQPILNYSRQYQIIGTNIFDPIYIMKLIHRLDQIVMSNRSMVHGINSKQTQHEHVLQCDMYFCEWLKQIEGDIQQRPKTQQGQEFFPVCVRGAGRPSLSEGDDNVLNIGILHLPHNNTQNKPKPSTLTLLPPEPHILIPLLLKAAEVENRALKKGLEKGEKMSLDASKIQKNLNIISKNVLLDENWLSEFRAYLFRLPPYYIFSLRVCLRQLLPSRCQSLISIDSVDNIVSQCFSRQCLHKIRSGEQLSRDNVDRLERKEEEHRTKLCDGNDQKQDDIGYGHFDKRLPINNYLNALRHMPPPWKPGTKKRKKSDESDINQSGMQSALHRMMNMPQQCLLAFYESRRNWIFGGSGLTTRGLSVEGVSNSGTNVHHVNAKRTVMDEPLISLLDIGASTLESTPVNKMGEFKGRLIFSKHSIIGYGCNDNTYSATTTAADGSPKWSIGDDVLPLGFFDPKTAEFNDSVENRIRSKLVINFGNPFKEKRGDSIIPEAFYSQRPPSRKNMSTFSSVLGSPPHDTFSNLIEGEGEANFVRTSPTHKTSFESDSIEEGDNNKRSKRSNDPNCITPIKTKPPPPPPSKGKSSLPSKKPKQGTPPPPPSKQTQKSGQIQKPPLIALQQPQRHHLSNTQSPTEKPTIELPPGWICVWSKSQRRWYYFDQRTNKSVWEWPPT